MPGLLQIFLGSALLGIAIQASAQAPNPGPRAAAEVLQQHRAALGSVQQVRTLATESTLVAGPQRAPGVKTWWGPRGGWMREYPATKKGQRIDYVGRESVYVYSGRSRAGYRADDPRYRAWYYALRALADPFPMRAYFGNPKAQRGLKTAYAKGFDILATPPDEFGVRALYLFERTTGHLSGIRFEERANQPFVTLQFERFEKVPVGGQGPGGKAGATVLLPFGAHIELRLQLESERGRSVQSSRVQMREQIQRWHVNPDEMPASLSVPSPAPEMAVGFARTSHRTGPSPQDLAVGDLDGDGRADIAVACVGGIWVHFGGAERAPVHVPLGKMTHKGCCIVDFDLDGRLDVLTMSWLKPSEMLFLVSFDKQRKPTKRSLYAAPGFGWGLAVDDFDLDGLPDFVATGYASRNVSWHFGNGSGGIRAVGTGWFLLKEGRNPERGFGVAVGDINGDGIRDVAVAEPGRPRIALFEGEPNLSFHPRAVLDPENSGIVAPVDVHFADVNGDGRDDLLVAQDHALKNLDADIGVFVNTGNGFRIAGYLAAGERMKSVRTGDIDGDGHLDIVASSHGTDQVAWLPGKGDGTFGAARFLGVGRGPVRTIVADINGDGRPDIVSSNVIDGSISICTNSNGEPAGAVPPPAKTSVIKAHVPGEFMLRGLSEQYEFAGEFQLPDSIPHPSGVAFMHGDGAHTGLVVLSDQKNAIFRATVDLVRGRLLVGPAIPLRGAPIQRFDLEGVAYDGFSGGTLFLAAESDNTILRATIFGDLLARAPTGVLLGSNDGIEAVALRRRLDGTPLLYLLKERLATTGAQPPVHVYDIEEDPFRLKQRGETMRLPLAMVDQTGAVADGQKLFVVSRLARSIAEIPFEGDGFSKKFKVAGFRRLTENLLGYPGLPSFGMVEGIARSHHGDLFLIVDNNGNEIGAAGKNRSRRGRLIWLRNVSPQKVAATATRIELRAIVIPFKGAKGAPSTNVTREKAKRMAEDCRRLIADGGSIDTASKRYSPPRPPLPRRFTLIRPPEQGRGGELKLRDVPVAVGRLGFALAVGAVGVCEYDELESPFGYIVVQRVK